MEKLRQAAIDALGRGDFRAAERACDKLAKAGGGAESTYLRGVMKTMQGKPLAAIPLLQLASEKQPQRSDILYNLGVALRDGGRLDEALAAWRRVTVLAPDRVDAWRNLALATAEAIGGEAAAKVYAEGLQRHPQDRELLLNGGNLLYRLGDLEASRALQIRLVESHPGFAAGWTSAAMTNRALGNFAEAEAQYRRAIAVGDAAEVALAHFNLANLLLLQGRWKEGFTEYEWRRRQSGAPVSPWPAPRWTPDLRAGGRVLLWNDQGLGDALQFLRFAKELAKRHNLVFFCQNALAPLAASVEGIASVVTPADAPQAVDAELPLSSLPHALGLSPEGSFAAPYLHAPSGPLPGEPIPGRMRIGLVWAGNPDHPNDRNRSMRLADLAPLFDLASVEWVSLQVGRGVDELRASPWASRIADLSPRLGDLSATAAAVRELDLVISVDTGPAHLAGGLGRPVFVALPFIGSDWRWGASGEASLWYPSMRLFRQTRAGDWSPLVTKMKELIAAKALPAALSS